MHNLRQLSVKIQDVCIKKLCFKSLALLITYNFDLLAIYRSNLIYLFSAMEGSWLLFQFCTLAVATYDHRE